MGLSIGVILGFILGSYGIRKKIMETIVMG